MTFHSMLKMKSVNQEYTSSSSSSAERCRAHRLATATSSLSSKRNIEGMQNTARHYSCSWVTLFFLGIFGFPTMITLSSSSSSSSSLSEAFSTHQTFLRKAQFMTQRRRFENRRQGCFLPFQIDETFFHLPSKRMSMMMTSQQEKQQRIRKQESFCFPPSRNSNRNGRRPGNIRLYASVTKQTDSDSSSSSTSSTPNSNANNNNDNNEQESSSNNNNNKTILRRRNKKWKMNQFDLPTALFCAGLAFDSYAEPPQNSTRWERGSKGMNVAFISSAFTRSLYKGLVEVKPLRCTDLPDEDDTAEGLLTGGGVDAYLLVGVVEGQWKEDIDLIEKSKYNEGVLELHGCAHVGRSTTAWSNVDERKAKIKLKKGESGAYHIKSSWGNGGQAVWEDDPPFYLYVQDPKTARLVFTVMDDDVVGGGAPIGSAHRKLADLLPNAKRDDAIDVLKDAVLKKLKDGGGIEKLKNSTGLDLAAAIVQSWEGEIALTSKPRKKDKKGQIALGAAAGAYIGGPVGAAAGGFLASRYEGDVRGKIKVGLRYLPIPRVEVKRSKYEVKGGLPGVQWGQLYENHINEIRGKNVEEGLDPHLAGNDLEFCFFITHDETGCSCAVYRSLEKKLIAISFRGTCAPIDLLTDASIAQAAWVEGEDVMQQGVAKVHYGFRNSLNSISRRLKELVLATVAPGENLSQYDMIVTGHSLGGALSTLFVADIAEYGVDAGRALPQLEPSEPWWNSIVSTFMRDETSESIGKTKPPPPRPKTLKMYNFGSPRVGNDAFADRFNSLVGNGIDEAYRIVNGQDVVARLPRTMNALALGSVNYDHCAPTALISLPKVEKREEGGNVQVEVDRNVDAPVFWVEGESDDKDCPVKDGTPLTNPLAAGSLLGDIFNVEEEKQVFNSTEEKKESLFDYASKLGVIFERAKGRLQKFSPLDLPSVVGIGRGFAEREVKIIQSIFNGEAIKHHLEDEYYAAMGRACGYMAMVGQQLIRLNDTDAIKSIAKENISDVSPESATGPEGDFDIWDAQLRVWEEGEVMEVVEKVAEEEAS